MKNIAKFLILILMLIFCSFLYSQNTLEEIVTWEMPEGVTFNCENFNSDGSDLNNDGFDDYINWSFGNPYKFQFFMGKEIPDTTFDFEIEVPFGTGFPSWGGDLNGDGYKDFVYSYCTDAFDPGDVYICFGSDEIDIEPDLILHGEDYVSDPTGLNYEGFNGGYDFNGDGYDDLLTWGEGPSYFWNGLVQIFFGGEELRITPDFQIQGNVLDEFGRYRAVGDINGDGYDDLIVSRHVGNSGSQLEVYLGGELMDTVPDFITDEIIQVDESRIMEYAGGDVNNDGFDDVLVSGTGIFLGNIDGVLNLDYPLSGDLKYVNINGDDYDDVLSSYSNTLNIFLGSEHFDTLPEITLNPTNYKFCNIGDFNNDGEDEILINNNVDNGIPGNSATMYGLPGGDNIQNDELQITNYELKNYPNPFNPKTTIIYKLPVNITNPIIEIFNIKGEKIRTFNCQNQIPIVWDGTDNYQNKVSSGVYLYRIKTENKVLISKEMLLLK